MRNILLAMLAYFGALAIVYVDLLVFVLVKVDPTFSTRRTAIHDSCPNDLECTATTHECATKMDFCTMHVVETSEDKLEFFVQKNKRIILNKVAPADVESSPNSKNKLHMNWHIQHPSESDTQSATNHLDR